MKNRESDALVKKMQEVAVAKGRSSRPCAKQGALRDEGATEGGERRASDFGFVNQDGGAGAASFLHPRLKH